MAGLVQERHGDHGIGEDSGGEGGEAGGGGHFSLSFGLAGVAGRLSMRRPYGVPSWDAVTLVTGVPVYLF